MMTVLQAADSVHGRPTLGRPSLARVRGTARQRSFARLVLVLGAIGAAGCSGVLPSPSRDVNQGQMMLDLTEALNAIRDQSASLQDQVDSLRDVMVRQDTVLRQLAVTAGIPMPVAK